MAALVLLAATPWPPAALRAYVDRCSASLQSQGMNETQASSYCRCVAGEMSETFGLEGYDEMMSAQPNATGTAADQKLYAIFSSCSTHLPS